MKKIFYQRYEHAGMSLPDRAFPHCLTEGVWLWSTYVDSLEMDCNGYLIQTQGQQAFTVDPPCAGPEVLDAFLGLPKPHSIILTNAHHERSSRAFQEAFGIPIFAPEADTPLLDYPPDHTYRAGTVFPNGWQSIALQDQKTPGECALYHPKVRMLIVGDALIGQPFQRVSMLPAEFYASKRDALQGLQVLRGLDIEMILPGHGDPVVQHGGALIQEALLDGARALMEDGADSH